MAKTKRSSSDAERPATTMDNTRIVRASVNRKKERAEEFVSLYANDAQFQTTPWDIRITFGSIAGAPSVAGTGQLVVKELAELHMSPQFAKRVAVVLTAQLKAYEAK